MIRHFRRFFLKLNCSFPVFNSKPFSIFSDIDLQIVLVRLELIVKVKRGSYTSYL